MSAKMARYRYIISSKYTARHIFVEKKQWIDLSTAPMWPDAIFLGWALTGETNKRPGGGWAWHPEARAVRRNVRHAKICRTNLPEIPFPKCTQHPYLLTFWDRLFPEHPKVFAAQSTFDMQSPNLSGLFMFLLLISTRVLNDQTVSNQTKLRVSSPVKSASDLSEMLLITAN